MAKGQGSGSETRWCPSLPDSLSQHVATTSKQYAVALSRAFAGALIFGLPLLMTMEMWWFGFTLEPWRILQFGVANLLLLYGLSKVAGFEESHHWLDDVLDAFAAYGVGVIAGATLLLLFDVIGLGMPAREVAGKIAIQAVPASFGAMIGAKMMGEGEGIEKRERWRATFAGRMFLTLAGALFLSFNVAPTEEVILIAYRIGPGQAMLVMLLSVMLLHAILYYVGFPGQDTRRSRTHGRALRCHSLPAYAIAVVASCYVLWTFGRTSGLDAAQIATIVIVLGLPAAIGAGIARVVV